jgi:PAS domain-containing protein
VAQTFDSLQPIEREVAGSDGRHYIVRIRPYRTGDDTIAGTVLTFFDISRRSAAEQAVRSLASDQEFLLRLGDSLRPLQQPLELLALGCRLLAERLGVARLAYGEFRAGRYAMLPGHAAGVAPLQGEGGADALEPAAQACWRAGETYVAPDLGGAAGGLSALAGGQGALLAAACRKGTRWLGFFLACQPAARDWTAQEIALFAEAAARIGVEFERARAQAALRASEMRLRALLQGFAESCWETDAGGEGGAGWLDAVHPEDRPRAEAMWREAVHKGRAMDAEVRLRGTAGAWRRGSVLATPLLDEQGAISKWSGCIVEANGQAALPSGSI